MELEQVNNRVVNAKTGKYFQPVVDLELVRDVSDQEPTNPRKLLFIADKPSNWETPTTLSEKDFTEWKQSKIADGTWKPPVWMPVIR